MQISTVIYPILSAFALSAQACLVADFKWNQDRNFIKASLVDNGITVCWINDKEDAFYGDWANLDCLSAHSGAIHKNPNFFRYTPPGRGDMLFDVSVGTGLGNKYVKLISAHVFGC